MRVWLLLALPCAAWGRVAAAQGGLVALDSAALAALATSASRIDSASVLRLATPWGSSILVDPRLDPAGIAYRQVRGDRPHLDGWPFQLQVAGRATDAGAVAGAVLGGLAGALYGRVAAGIAGVDGQTTGTAATAGAVILSGVLGAGLGAMVGVVMGTLVPGWRTIYQHPDRLDL